MKNDNQQLPHFSLPELESNKEESERAEYIVKMETEHAEEMETAREHFNNFGIETREEADNEGDERLGFYLKNSNGTSIQDLMAMCDADLPYVDERTAQDYLKYKEIYDVQTKPVRGIDRREEMRKRRGR